MTGRQKRLVQASFEQVSRWNSAFERLGVRELVSEKNLILTRIYDADPLDSEPTERLFKMISDLRSAKRRIAGRAAVRITDLGRDLR